jgi:hemerythrin-like domain-containing protein
MEPVVDPPSVLLGSLRRQHETILLATGALRSFADRHAARAPEARKILGYFVLFFRQFLDQWHHGIEERLLFPAMVHAGVPESGPMGCMLREHDDGRLQLDAFAAMTSGMGPLSEREVLVLRELAGRYAQLLEHHVAVENQTVFPLARRVLLPEQLAALDASADEVTAAWGQTGLDLQELGETLAGRFGVLPPLLGEEAARCPGA